MSPFLSWRPLVGSLRALASAELAALKCITAGQYWLPPRRAPFGRKENPPQAGVPPDSASPRSLATVCEEARASMVCPEAGRQNLAILSTQRNGDIPLYWHTGTELKTVVAGAWIAVSGSAHGERRVSGVRRAAPLWWFSPDRRVSTHSVERCQLQRASRAMSERQKFPSQEIFEAREP